MLFDQPFGGLFSGARGAVLAVLLRTGTPLTGRQVHAMTQGGQSLWSVQQTLADLANLGIVNIEPVGRAHLHSINERHYAVGPLRALMDPFSILREVVRHEVGDAVHAVILFGSVARGEATSESDVDLAVIADLGWSGRVELEDAVHSQLGVGCDVLVFTPDEFVRFARTGEEPVVQEILADGVTLVGAVPHGRSTVA